MPFIFRSQEMKSLVAQAQRFAESSATVLILGESGTGKELLARYLHEHSPRADKPYLRVNCASLHENLIESELFGHVRGAFTGAISDRKGCMEVAGHGTLFLDEIGELPWATQAKLLRALEEKEFSQVGSHELLHVDARIIAATNRDIEKEIDVGRFREDLFHRLDVLTLRVAPLRERKEDIAPLAKHFVACFRDENPNPVTSISPDTLRQLVNFEWPGNVRQLRNMIHRACVTSDSHVIDAMVLPYQATMSLDTTPSTGDSTQTLKELERQEILRRVEHFSGNRTKAALSLGITPKTLRTKLAEYAQLKIVHARTGEL